jgi:hypothetical protein
MKHGLKLPPEIQRLGVDLRAVRKERLGAVVLR